jgi:ankyrin repeat protein
MDAGAELEADSEQQSEMLIKAINNDNPNTAQLLLEAGASPNATMNGLLALPFAVLRGHPEVVQALLDAGADPNATMGQNEPITALIIAADGDHAFALETRGLTEEKRNRIVSFFVGSGG